MPWPVLHYKIVFICQGSRTGSKGESKKMLKSKLLVETKYDAEMHSVMPMMLHGTDLWDFNTFERDEKSLQYLEVCLYWQTSYWIKDVQSSRIGRFRFGLA